VSVGVYWVRGREGGGSELPLRGGEGKGGGGRGGRGEGRGRRGKKEGGEREREHLADFVARDDLEIRHRQPELILRVSASGFDQ
jgi:hypothetical protein